MKRLGFSIEGFDNIVKRVGLFFKKFDDRKIVIILFLVVVGLLSIFYNHDMSRKNDLIKDLSSDYDYVYNSYLALNETYYDLLSNKRVLEGYYNDALNMYEYLYNNYSDALDINNELMDEYLVLQTILSNTTNGYSELQILYLQLSGDYDDLVLVQESSSNYSDINVLADVEIMSINPEEFLTYNYNISNPGYFEVIFSSSVDIFVWVGSSGSNPGYYSRYPYYPNTAFDGTFLVPVVGDEVYLWFENPSEVSVANIEFSVFHMH